jgi:hypothetical protein
MSLLPDIFVNNAATNPEIVDLDPPIAGEYTAGGKILEVILITFDTMKHLKLSGGITEAIMNMPIEIRQYSCALEKYVWVLYLDKSDMPSIEILKSIFLTSMLKFVELNSKNEKDPYFLDRQTYYVNHLMQIASKLSKLTLDSGDNSAVDIDDEYWRTYTDLMPECMRFTAMVSFVKILSDTKRSFDALVKAKKEDNGKGGTEDLW